MSVARASTRHAVLRFAVRDSGIGVAAERLDALFEPFTQEDDSITRKYGGTGLGLAICKQLVEMIGGTLSARSELGHGSEFSFTASLGVDASFDTIGQRSPIIAGLKGARALVVDDNALARDVLAGLLTQMGMHTDSASSGEEGLAMPRGAGAAASPYSLMLLDCNMPGSMRRNGAPRPAGRCRRRTDIDPNGHGVRP
jgi:hypothetical protein